MTEKQSCKTCTFSNVFPSWMEPTEHEPCLSCENHSNWRKWRKK